MYLIIIPFLTLGLAAKIANKKMSKNSSSSDDVNFNNIVKAFNHQPIFENMWGSIQNEDVRQTIQESEFTEQNR